MIKKQKKPYQYTDLSMVCGIVSMAPEIRTGQNGKSCVEFSLGQKYGKKENAQWKNYKARVYNQEIGNEILALVKKNDSIMVLGHLNAYVYNTKTGETKAGMAITVTEWKKAPDAQDANQMRQKLRTADVADDEDETEEPEDTNEEILF